MLGDWIALLLHNFDLAMFVLAIFFMLLNWIVTRGRVPEYEIVYRWLALFGLGFTGLYASILHGFFPDSTATTIGWATSPFQSQVAMANLGFGLLGVLSFNASYAFRLATVIGATCWLWGAALGHLEYQPYLDGNAGTWLWMDIIVPALLISCIVKLKPKKLLR